ncbi:response regulator [SAR86 cluster bacterium]|uniref:Phosphate regulon transcriptional regulatory protein PhoB n=1 Tax=SAR86 cluster bacterium TaxID=2030880 RepID=A0A9Q8U1V5_9GAMM|nr:response regulator [SAR86 cluster bacterium]
MSQKIYIVEDEPDIRETLKYNFSNEGFKVFTAPDGEKALSNIKKVLPDVLILDLMLPGVSGLDVCKSIRADDDIRDMSIIMLTAKGEEIDRVIGFELGADDYVTKPFSVRELILRVKVLLKKQRESLVANKLVTFGPIRIDLDAHELKINDKEIVLTALEFKLLQHLVKRKGRVQTREQLLGDVWGYSAEVTTRTVDTHIKRLREKLGNTSDYIQTIRGVGYRFSNVD